jgi:hypothetical protein
MLATTIFGPVLSPVALDGAAFQPWCDDDILSVQQAHLQPHKEPIMGEANKRREHGLGLKGPRAGRSGHFAQVDELLALIPNAVEVQSYVAMRGDFDEAQLQVTSMGRDEDPAGWRATNDTLTKYGEQVRANGYHPDFGPNAFCLVVLFEPEEIGSEAVRMWNSYFKKATKKRRWVMSKKSTVNLLVIKPNGAETPVEITKANNEDGDWPRDMVGGMPGSKFVVWKGRRRWGYVCEDGYHLERHNPPAWPTS